MVNHPDAKFQDILVVQLTVDYSLRIDEMIAAGNYDRNRGQNADASTYVSGKSGFENISLHLLTFDYLIKPDQAVNIMHKYGFRPADLHELLTIGIQCPELQCQYGIAGLGSTLPIISLGIHLYDAAPYLGGYELERYLTFVPWNERFGRYCHFAAVKKI